MVGPTKICEGKYAILGNVKKWMRHSKKKKGDKEWMGWKEYLISKY